MTLPTKTTYMSALKLCLGRMLLWLPEELAYPQEGLGPLQKAAITKGAIWIGPAPAIPSHWTSPGGCQVWPAPAPGEMWGHPHAGQKVCFTWMQAGPEASLWAQQRNMRELDTKNRVAYAGMSAKEKRNIRNKLTFSTEPTWCGLVIRGPPKWVTWNKGLGGGGGAGRWDAQARGAAAGKYFLPFGSFSPDCDIQKFWMWNNTHAISKLFVSVHTFGRWGL